VRWITARVILRCRTHARSAFRWQRRLADGERAENALATLAVPAAQERDVRPNESERAGLRRWVDALERLRARARQWPVLEDVVVQIQAYLAERLGARLPASALSGTRSLEHLID